ncbi:MAG TPA: hypothetical protein PKA80_14855 [Ignavibacteriaceae bacterium]|nr:hypothetical protein [Ignavibacteriaceae bacterium]
MSSASVKNTILSAPAGKHIKKPPPSLLPSSRAEGKRVENG